MGRKRIILSTPEDTLNFGAEFASELTPNAVLALSGPLGAGKTTFVQGLLKGLKIPDLAQSPTFTYLQIYEGIFHFDLYRLKSEQEFLQLGFDEFLDSGKVTVIEWPERIASLLPKDCRLIRFSMGSPGRIVEITSWGQS